jgi:hypothetical protein
VTAVHTPSRTITPTALAQRSKCLMQESNAVRIEKSGTTKKRFQLLIKNIIRRAAL